MNIKDEWMYSHNDGDKRSNSAGSEAQAVIDSEDASHHHYHQPTPPLPPPQQSNKETKHDIPPKYGGPVRRPNSSDVLSGRGRHIDTHEGNIHFRNLVATYRETYLSPDTKKRDKATIANQLIQQIRKMVPAGRFLEKDKADGRWYEIGDARARKKAGQAMREKKTPAITFDVDMFLDSKPSASSLSSKSSNKAAETVDEPTPSLIPSNSMSTNTSSSNHQQHQQHQQQQQHENLVQHQEPRGLIPTQIQSSFVNTINNARENFQQRYSLPLNMNPFQHPPTSMPSHHNTQHSYAQYPTRVQSSQIPDRMTPSKKRALQSLDEEHSIHGAPSSMTTTTATTTTAATTTTTTSSLQDDPPNIYDAENKTLQEAEEIIKGGELFNKTTSTDRLAKLLYPEGGASGRAERRRSRLTREGSTLGRMEHSHSNSSSSSSSPITRKLLLGSRDDSTNSSLSLQRADTCESGLQNERPPLYSRNSSQGSNTSSLFSNPVHAGLDDNDSTALMMEQMDFSVKSSSSSIHSSVMSGYDSEISNMDLRSIFST